MQNTEILKPKSFKSSEIYNTFHSLQWTMDSPGLTKFSFSVRFPDMVQMCEVNSFFNNFFIYKYDIFVLESYIY